MKAIYTLLVALSAFSLCSCSEVRYANLSSSETASATPAPIFCGGCQLIYEVHGHVWWPTVYTDYVETITYTVEEGSGSTIGSSIEHPNTTTVFGDGINFTSIAFNSDGGGVETTYLNSLSNGPAATVIQQNEITMSATDYTNGYILSTQFLNDSFTGPARTQCVETYFTRNTTTTTNLPGLPAVTRYTYTTVVPFDDSYNMSKAIQYGIDSLASHVATYLGLSIPACTSNTGGGVGTLKIGVTALTSRKTVYAQAQDTPTPTPSPSASVSPGKPSPSPTPSSPSPSPTTSASPSPPSPPSEEPPSSTPGDSTTNPSPEQPPASAPQGSTTNPIPGQTTSPSSPEAPPGSASLAPGESPPNTPATPPTETTIQATINTVIPLIPITTTGSDGLETVTYVPEAPSEGSVTTDAVASYIASIIGATGTASGSGSESSTTTTLTSISTSASGAAESPSPSRTEPTPEVLPTPTDLETSTGNKRIVKSSIWLGSFGALLAGVL